MPPQKGKQGTRGAKQIVQENAQTIKNYSTMSVVATAIQLSVLAIFYSGSFTTCTIILIVLSLIIHVVGYKFFCYMSKATYSETGQLLDSGVDLNMKGGVGEHVTDLIILTSGTQVLTLLSDYFWLLLLLIPIRAGYMLWRSVLGPWFFQEAPQEPEMSEKKQRKLERKKMMRN